MTYQRLVARPVICTSTDWRRPGWSDLPDAAPPMWLAVFGQMPLLLPEGWHEIRLGKRRLIGAKLHSLFFPWAQHVDPDDKKTDFIKENASGCDHQCSQQGWKFKQIGLLPLKS